jgi:hypothetical protein
MKETISSVKLPKLEVLGWEEIGKFECARCGWTINLPVNAALVRCQTCGCQEFKCYESWAVPLSKAEGVNLKNVRMVERKLLKHERTEKEKGQLQRGSRELTGKWEVVQR